MKKLGKRVAMEEKSLKAYAFCVCSNCPCGPTTSSPQTSSAKSADSSSRAR